VSRRKVIIDKQEVDFTVVQADPTKLKATVAPSGDMARKAHYDRNPTTVFKRYGGTVPAGTAWTQAWSYTVPTGKKVFINPCFLYIIGPIQTSGRIVATTFQAYDAVAALWSDLAYVRLKNGEPFIAETIQEQFYASAGAEFRGMYRNQDTTSHWITNTVHFMEFDA